MAAKDVVLPDIGEGVTEGELVKYLVKVGDKVKEDQAVAEVMTDKATVEVPSPFGGTVKELKLKEGEIVGIGKTLVVLEVGGSSTTSAPAPKAEAPSPAPAISAKTLTPVTTSIPTHTNSPMTAAGLDVYPPVASSTVLATPGTRRLAREMGVDINKISGTGNAGRVTREDIIKTTEAAVPAGPASYAPTISVPTMARNTTPGAEERVPLKGIRRKIAESMQLSKRIIPHFTIMDEANVTKLFEMRNSLKPMAEKQGIKITYLPFVMKALIATAREFPMFNASIDDNAHEIVYKKFFNIGFAADTPNGLLVPVVKDADHKTILQMSKEIVELSGKARDGKLALEDMKGASMTITNIGSIGGNYATPIINHPEVIILGMYKMTDKPHWNGSAFVPIKSMNFTVTADHRLIDGAVAANFLKAFINRIENPSVLMLDMM
ncbi:MAG: hypothetical protein A4S09_05915 [Proteobacteria bacterium SG_bin7]|nr:MAG: hypothetical protein A4S09_05915 [Proteobacteria bacterium SG_bin7]